MLEAHNHQRLNVNSFFHKGNKEIPILEALLFILCIIFTFMDFLLCLLSSTLLINILLYGVGIKFSLLLMFLTFVFLFFEGLSGEHRKREDQENDKAKASN